ncbi:MAG: PaaI family thioesterase [Planctomycetota bacterium]|nr:PaaI family thioesterase [Planctomycetota bacterium]
MSEQSLQERYAPTNRCFGCGPANEQGLRIRSFPEDGALVCAWLPQKHHEAWDGMLNGGICGALLDCHSNWAAAFHLMQRRGLEELPSTVTAEFHVKLRAPTPTDEPLQLRAEVVESTDNKAVVEATITAKGNVTCTCRGVFISVEPGHPAYHRW